MPQHTQAFFRPISLSLNTGSSSGYVLGLGPCRAYACARRLRRRFCCTVTSSWRTLQTLRNRAIFQNDIAQYLFVSPYCTLQYGFCRFSIHKSNKMSRTIFFILLLCDDEFVKMGLTSEEVCEVTQRQRKEKDHVRSSNKNCCFDI